MTWRRAAVTGGTGSGRVTTSRVMTQSEALPGLPLSIGLRQATPTSPRLFPLSLNCASPDSRSNQVVLGCLVQGFFPAEPMNVSWSSSEPGTSVRNFRPMQTSGGLYTMASQLTLPADQCPRDTTKECHVQHNSKPEQTVTVTAHCKGIEDPNPCCEPQLTLHQPALEDLLLGNNANVTCTVTGLKDPKGATFTWNPTGGNAILGDPEENVFGCYSVSSTLTGCADQWNRGDTFSCTVNHPKFKNPKTATISKNRGSAFPPQVHLLPPPSEELALNELVTLTCVVRGFSPRDVLVLWLHGSEQLPRDKYVTWGPLREAGRDSATFAVTSVLRVGAEEWKNGDTFSCMVGHEALPLNFTQKTIDRLAGKPSHVNVSVVLSEVEGVCY